MGGLCGIRAQWLLIGRREDYEAGSGEHKLWLSVGGSAGHGGLYALDINEGPSGADRHWNVELSTPDAARREKKAGSIRDRFLDAAREFPNGETKTVLFQAAKVRWDDHAQVVFDSLVNEGDMVPCEVRKGRVNYAGFRLA